MIPSIQQAGCTPDVPAPGYRNHRIKGAQALFSFSLMAFECRFGLGLPCTYTCLWFLRIPIARPPCHPQAYCFPCLQVHYIYGLHIPGGSLLPGTSARNQAPQHLPESRRQWATRHTSKLFPRFSSRAGDRAVSITDPKTKPLRPGTPRP